MEIFGFFGALLIGLILGLIGGGGSILTVPILVYVFGVSPVLATSYSLFVVGFTAIIGAVRNYQSNMVDLKTGVIFAIPAFIGVFFSRKFILPVIPNQLVSFNSFLLTKDTAIMLFFALIMFVAAFFMIKDRTQTNSNEAIKYNIPLLTIDGLIIGVLTGLVGAGGGFLIIPALVFFAKLPMKKAVATSLMIIAIKSLIGFTGDLGQLQIDWMFLLSFTAVSVTGIFIGIYFNQFVKEKQLKRGFGFFIIIMSITIIIKELI
ncbi:sulfite exporter TauE/SafE family protein [Flavobacteriales bacterium]|jgi:uncharacterized protein|nr:sulfite exporter TauE/SafE family protein [Flavobacteriales bacterium]